MGEQRFLENTDFIISVIGAKEEEEGRTMKRFTLFTDDSITA